jgi:hypothetical protein
MTNPAAARKSRHLAIAPSIFKISRDDVTTKSDGASKLGHSQIQIRTEGSELGHVRGAKLVAI